MSTTNKVNLDELTVDTTIELLWPPSGQWQTGTITHVWGNGEFAIQFEDDPFDEPLSYRLESYEFRVLSNPLVKKEKNIEENPSGDIDMKDKEEETKTETETVNGNGTSNNNNKNNNNTENATTTTAETEDEIEAVVDFVENTNSECGDIFCVYRIKWKGFSLVEATWEPKDHLSDASEMIDRYNKQISSCNPNSSTIRSVRKSPFDNNLLHDLWNILNEISDITEEENNKYGIQWQSEGRAFQVFNVEKFINNFMSRNKHNIIEDGNYESFSNRMTILGFEQEIENKSYHHPCFNKKNNKLIDFIGKNSIPLPDDDEKAALFKSRVAKEKQQQIHPIIDNIIHGHGNNINGYNNEYEYNNRKRKRENNNINKQNNNNIDISNYNYGLFVPIESGLDLNQCHLWTEHQVGEWIRHLPDWGNYYAAKFLENGIDGRILLEYDNLELIMKEADIQPIHKATFIYGVNMLRNVRKKGIQQMRQSQAK